MLKPAIPSITLCFPRNSILASVTQLQMHALIVASTRSELQTKNLTETEKRMESASFILHRRRVRAFYDMLGIVAEGHVTLCFDMMQNLVPSKNRDRTGLLLTPDVSVPVWCGCASWGEQLPGKR